MKRAFGDSTITAGQRGRPSYQCDVLETGNERFRIKVGVSRKVRSSLERFTNGIKALGSTEPKALATYWRDRLAVLQLTNRSKVSCG
jgi:hypothetical protein